MGQWLQISVSGFDQRVVLKIVNLIEQQYKIWVPGFGTDELRPFKRAIITEAHKQRTSLIRKARKNWCS